MYGQIHLIVREMMEEMYGHETWKKVLELNQLDEEDHFKMFKTYPDETTLALFKGVSATIDTPFSGVLQAFGNYFPTWAMKHGFDKMLTTLGGDLVSFIENLDSLHSLLSFSFKKITAPSFRCEYQGGSLLLHYYSVRQGLYPIVIGMLETVGKVLYSETCTILFLSEQLEDTGMNENINHAQFKIIMDKKDGDTKSPARMGLHRCRGSTRLTPDNVSQKSGTPSVIRSEDFNAAFPYHILMDRSMAIKECGDYIQTLSVIPVVPGTHFREVAFILYPTIAPTTENVVNFINSNFIIGLHRQPGQESITLKGQMVWLPHCSHLMFIGSPKLMRLEDFENMKLFFCDVPKYDVTRELVLLNQQRIAEIDLAHKLDEATTELKKVSKQVELEKQKTEAVLLQMMPHKIAAQLTTGLTVSAEKYESCTMLFGDIVTFTEIAQKCRADDIVNMLNDIYHRFDMHTDAHNVYKVETIGDAYMAVTGVPEVQADHAERMANFAMDMHEEAGYVKSPATGKPLRIRVGLHSGGVVAGVIGKRRPRYDIYGDTVNTASRMESYSSGGRIHISLATFNLLYPYGYKFRDRGDIIVKGKGEMRTYFLIGHIMRELPEPQDTFCELPILEHPEPINRGRQLLRVNPTSTMEVQKLAFVTTNDFSQSEASFDLDFGTCNMSTNSNTSSKRISVSQVTPNMPLPPTKSPGNVSKSSLMQASSSPPSSPAVILQDLLRIDGQENDLLEPRVSDSPGGHGDGRLSGVSDRHPADHETGSPSTQGNSLWNNTGRTQSMQKLAVPENTGVGACFCSDLQPDEKICPRPDDAWTDCAEPSVFPSTRKAGASMTPSSDPHPKPSHTGGCGACPFNLSSSFSSSFPPQGCDHSSRSPVNLAHCPCNMQ